MTETELTDQLREAIVLDGPDAWRTNGYLQEAQRAGISLTDALKRAGEISQEVSNNSILFDNIKRRIARLGDPSRVHLIDQDLNQIVNAASSLHLSPDFVKHRWVPSVLQESKAASTPKKPVPPVTPSEPATTPPVIQPDDLFAGLIEETPEPVKVVVPPIEPAPAVIEPVVPAPLPPKPEPVQKSVEPVLPPSPPPVVRSFTATPARVNKGQPVTLAWEVDNLLAVTIDDLGEGLSPSNRGWVKPGKTTDYTLFDVNGNPLSTVRVEVNKPDRSGVYGVLFALVLLVLIYWFVKNTNSEENHPREKPKTEQKPERKNVNIRQPEPERQSFRPTTSKATDTPAEPPVEEPVTAASGTPPPSSPANEAPAPAEPEANSATPAEARVGKYEEAFGDKPYDKVELGTDEQGWRRARKGGRWGYVNAADEWVIEPEYEAVTPFRGNTATVFLNGQLVTINRAGEQIRK